MIFTIVLVFSIVMSAYQQPPSTPAQGFECDCGQQAVYQETQKGTIIVCPVCVNPTNPKYKKVVSWGDMEFASKPKNTPRYKKKPASNNDTYNSPAPSVLGKRTAPSVPNAPVKAPRPMYKAQPIPPAPYNSDEDTDPPHSQPDPNEVFQREVMQRFQELLDVWSHEKNLKDKTRDRTNEKLDKLIEMCSRHERDLTEIKQAAKNNSTDDQSE